MRLLIRLLLNLAVIWLTLRRVLASLGLAESSILWTTGTTGDGTSTYTEAQATAHWGDWFTPNSTITNPHASQGVLAGAGGELAVTGTSSPVAVASGAALVEGYPYRSTASTNVTISTPSSATRIDRIVLRVSHSTTRTVRITRIAGTEGAGVPSLTQTAGTTWDIPLAQCSITTGGVITVTDERTFAHFASRLDRNRIDGGTSTRIPFNDTNGRLTDSADLTFTDSTDTLAIGGETTIANIANQTRIAENAAGGSNAIIDLDPIPADGTSGAFVRIGRTTNTTADTLLQVLRGNNSATVGVEMNGSAGTVTITPAAAGAPMTLGANGQGQKVTGLNADQIDGLDLSAGRRGGSATDWNSPGTTDRTVTNIRMYFGEIQWTGAAASSGSQSVTFPGSFSGLALMFANCLTPGVLANCNTTAVNTGSIFWNDTNGSNRTLLNFMWVAFGPE